ncbi:hypothetical protein RhiirA5_417451 [Rhizophagus irregularis]|uniref:Uncharacterized protein n=3 Tax=Rhizophagus irregularis TaxID=588596 RepID=A0A2I1EYK2_9GLOM|nr:hypothetical protein GLOIN_2v1697803 [Rhizophagus irregularis DAOM 181602=DAOM 197198]EXX58393.1 hypothetical protein RirG_198370 [Rhizophagus irregularis DAOM 197198w]PKC08014.1 hypothetical protein RhiirA5_417451 [Rhizophagus irregularis]PKC64305.1 hypothetical protein RhiirA1_462605 [Rhizophagus irregularis]PKK72177.1 hypothetical protein RhiirC2_777509 [Rhizophagus irregularis]PKY27211.1 hypothetical protein RhiirB3_442825 [Rhizophagus irregularis]|eukprot:XP_025169147.1 hypothetical protein GLOIN_2v1697803 [Rhizophagus irregularis DAOM 181602=DAOM 197198]
MEFPPSESILQDYENSLEAIQKERRKIKKSIHKKLLQTSEDVGSSVQIDDNKSLKVLENDYHKIYLSEVNLSEKLMFTKQIYRLLFEFNDTQKSDEFKPFIEKYEEEVWINDMQNLDKEFLNTPYTIQKMLTVYENDETDEPDKILTKWYWQLKAYLRHVPSEKNLTSLELLLVDVVAYDITYNCNKPNKPMLKFSSRHSGHIIQICVTSDSRFKINFDLPLIKAIEKFHELSPSIDFPNFIKYVIWNEMDELFEYE